MHYPIGNHNWKKSLVFHYIKGDPQMSFRGVVNSVMVLDLLYNFSARN